VGDGRRASASRGGAASGRDGARWERRWVAGLAVRAVVTGVPFVVAVAGIAVAGRLVPRPEGGGGVAGWYAGLCVGSWALMWGTHRWLHRLLPLAGLLEMSLLFPERAPSRVRLARRVASRRDLDELLAGGVQRADETTQEAAERILSLVSALRDHDRGTRGHSERVRVLTDLIAARMGIGEDDRDRLRWAALLHDIGKLRVPTTLLNKPGFPTPAEWHTLRNHPHHGEELARPLLAWLGPWGDVIVQHHEKFDGSGYPRGLAGQDICLGARIVAVADAFDVMTAARAYKKPTGRAAALRELVACSGAHFDPQVVRALIDVPQRQLLLTMGPLSWLTGLPMVGQSPSALSAALTSQTTVAAGAIALTGTATLTPLGLAASSSEAPATRPPAVSRQVRPAHRGAATPAARPTGKARPTARTRSGLDAKGDVAAPDPAGDAPQNGPDAGSDAGSAAGTSGGAASSGGTSVGPDDGSNGSTDGGSGGTDRPAGPRTPPARATDGGDHRKNHTPPGPPAPPGPGRPAGPTGPAVPPPRPTPSKGEHEGGGSSSSSRSGMSGSNSGSSGGSGSSTSGGGHAAGSSTTSTGSGSSGGSGGSGGSSR